MYYRLWIPGLSRQARSVTFLGSAVFVLQVKVIMSILDSTSRRPDGQPEDDRGGERLSRDAVGSRSGDSFESVFLHHWQTVYAVLFRLVGTREEAEDLAQEVFIRLYQKPLPAERSHNVGGWLYRVATNLGFNALRAKRRRLVRESLPPDPAAEPLPLDRALAEEDRLEVRRALADLSERQQACLVLKYQGFSYAEIADSLGVNPSSVGTILARAEAEFRRHYLDRRGGM